MVHLWWVAIIVMSLIALLSGGWGGLFASLVAALVLSLFVYE